MDTFKNRRQNLRILLDQRGWSQAQAAGQLGITAPQVSQVLKGTRNMGEAIARRIELAAGLPPLWMDEEQEHFKTDTKPDFFAEEDQRRFVRKLELEQRRELRKAITTHTEDVILDILSKAGIYFDAVEMDARIMTTFGPVMVDFLIKRQLAVEIAAEDDRVTDKVFTLASKLHYQVTPAPVPLFIVIGSTSMNTLLGFRQMEHQLDQMVSNGLLVGWSRQPKDILLHL